MDYVCFIHLLMGADMIISPTEIGIIAKDLSNLQDFYTKAFNIQLVSEIDVERFPDFVLSATPYKVIRLQFPFGERLKLLGSRQTVARSKSPIYDLTKTQGLIFLTIIVDNLEEARQNIVSCGGRILEDPVKLREGMRLSFASDPEGNLIELTEYDPITLYRTDISGSNENDSSHI